MLSVGVLIVAPKELPAEERPAAAADARDPTGELRTAMVEALNDDLAHRIRELTHPTGEGGTLRRQSFTCDSRACATTFDVNWKGGFTSSSYTTTVTWTVTLDCQSTSSVDKETSIISADDEHKKEVEKYLQTVADGWRSRINAGGAQ